MGGPRIQVVEDTDALSRAGADLLAGSIAAIPGARVVVATGHTPMATYAELAERRRSGLFDPAAMSVLQLDEYLGLEPGDRRSLYGWMQRSFLGPMGIAEDRVARLPVEGDLDAACAGFDQMIDSRGGLDLAILGLGLNGHLGFNEPPADRSAPTRVVDLSPVTIAANARYWGSVGAVPTKAVTIGMRQLLSARAIVMVVSGEGKRAIVHRSLEGSVGPDVPASFLQVVDSGVTVIVDRAAWGEG